eukprot:scaffold8717_cov167-Amphora_coffeaeformis.AAC.6
MSESVRRSMAWPTRVSATASCFVSFERRPDPRSRDPTLQYPGVDHVCIRLWQPLHPTVPSQSYFSTC